MTPAQITKTQVEFGKAWQARRACGGGDLLNREAWRLSLKIRARAVDRAGRPLSSKGMNNDHVDAFLKLCKGYSAPSSLSAQLDLESQPTKRALVAAETLLDALAIAESGREAYLAGIYRNVQRKRIREEGMPEISLDQMPIADLGLVISALHHTASHKLGRNHNHPRTGRGPRSQIAHRVGLHSSKPAMQNPSAITRSTAAPQPIPFDISESF